MKIGIYGLGRFGMFWANTLSENVKDAQVVAYSKHSKGFKNTVSVEECLSSDLIFFCTSISSFEDVLKNNAHLIKKGATVLDTCSVKVNPALWMKKYLNVDEYTLIATHPMFGPDSAKDGIKNLPLVFSPLSKENEKTKAVEDMFNSMGLNVVKMSVREHDKQAAYSQGITHFVGRTLSTLGLDDTCIATNGYKTLMTIVEQTCNDSMQLFYDLQRFNPYAKEMRLSLQVALEKVLNQLAEQEE